MAKFTALPVTKGDAFLLELGAANVLIDGGFSKTKLPGLLRAHSDVRELDVVVCTHNDSDHVNGLIGLIGAVPCKELWLPGSFAAVLEGLLKPLPQLVDEIHGFYEFLVEVDLPLQGDLSSFLDARVPQEDGWPLFEQYGEQIAKQRGDVAASPSDGHSDGGAEESSDGGAEESSDGHVPHGGYAESWRMAFEAGHAEHVERWLSAMAIGFRGGDMPVGRVWLNAHPLVDPTVVWNMLADFFEAGERILRLAEEAYHAGVPIRWFEFDPSRQSGGEHFLRPVNSCEVAKIVPAGTLFNRAALSTANRESLVFWSPGEPGVFFSADSLLDFDLSAAALKHAIVTAPHHGSETNADAYRDLAIAGADQTARYVRSDGRVEKNPGQTYINLKGRRACTICMVKAEPTTKRAVRLDLVAGKHGGYWRRRRDSPACTCAK